MHTTFQTQITAIIAFVLIMMGIVFGLSVFSESNQQMATNSAVQAAIMDSRDDDARAVRGVFAINQSVLERDLGANGATSSGQYADILSHWRKKKYKNLQVKVYYLRNTSENAQKFEKINKNPDSIPVKGIKIMVLGVKPGGTKEEVVDTATYVISSRVNLAPHNNDVSGDDVSNEQLPQKVIQ